MGKVGLATNLLRAVAGSMLSVSSQLQNKAKSVDKVQGDVRSTNSVKNAVSSVLSHMPNFGGGQKTSDGIRRVGLITDTYDTTSHQEAMGDAVKLLKNVAGGAETTASSLFTICNMLPTQFSLIAQRLRESFTPTVTVTASVSEGNYKSGAATDIYTLSGGYTYTITLTGVDGKPITREVTWAEREALSEAQSRGVPMTMANIEMICQNARQNNNTAFSKQREPDTLMLGGSAAPDDIFKDNGKLNVTKAKEYALSRNLTPAEFTQFLAEYRRNSSANLPSGMTNEDWISTIATQYTNSYDIQNRPIPSSVKDASGNVISLDNFDPVSFHTNYYAVNDADHQKAMFALGSNLPQDIQDHFANDGYYLDGYGIMGIAIGESCGGAMSSNYFGGKGLSSTPQSRRDQAMNITSQSLVDAGIASDLKEAQNLIKNDSFYSQLNDFTTYAINATEDNVDAHVCWEVIDDGLRADTQRWRDNEAKGVYDKATGGAEGPRQVYYG